MIEKLVMNIHCTRLNLNLDRAVSRSPEPSCTLQTRVNPLLKNADHIIVDLSLPESEFSALMKKTHSKVTDATGISLQCEATNPIVKELQITCEEFGKFEKDWKMSISSERTITVEFLLRAIHKAMRTQITCSEWNRMSDSEKAHVNKSYARRLGVSTAWSEPFGSVRRVDVLKDKFYFGGLKPEKDDDPKNFKLSVKEK